MKFTEKCVWDAIEHFMPGYIAIRDIDRFSIPPKNIQGMDTIDVARDAVVEAFLLECYHLTPLDISYLEVLRDVLLEDKIDRGWIEYGTINSIDDY